MSYNTFIVDRTFYQNKLYIPTKYKYLVVSIILFYHSLLHEIAERIFLMKRSF